MTFRPPAFEDLSDYYKSYWKFLSESDLMDALIRQTEITHKTLSSVPAGAETFRYGDGKWMIREVAGHLCDTERILCYRALRFSRNDQTPLSAFDENAYVVNSNFASRPLQEITGEWKSVRNATLSLFGSMTDEMADRKGTANNVTVSARIILYFILVHERHHLSIVNERYLSVYGR